MVISNLQDKLSRLDPKQYAALKSKLYSYAKADNPMKFSLFFFSDNGSNRDKGKYELLIESALYADKNDFESIWIPERHFHEFGSPYPSPSVLLSALTQITKNIKLRSGSVVIPLHHPMRIAEEWSVLNNLSNGRVGLSCASGWNEDDFILSHNDYKKRKEIMFESIDIIKKLWRNEEVEFKDSNGRIAKVSLFPKPCTDELPVWITSAGNPETWIKAARINANILTGLMEQSVEQLAEKIQLYKKELINNGYNPLEREISVMLHTYVGVNVEEVKRLVKPPLVSYLSNHLSLYEKHLNHAQNKAIDLTLVTDSDKNTLIEMGFERYFKQSALLGTKETCSQMISKLHEAGVTEVCCLINFGLPHDIILSGLSYLNELRKEVTKKTH